MQQIHDTLPVGTVIQNSKRDRYIVEGLLGKGGFGAIYLVRDQRVKQNLFALKQVISPNKREWERFTFECKVLMRLDHQALPRVYRMFEDLENNSAYILMDYIEGPNLELLRQQQPEQRFSFPEVLRMMAPIVNAIAFLHSQDPPIVHRDIKPTNIIVPATGDDAILVDFSIAKEYESEETTTAIRHCSPGYAAPEQYGIGTTPRTDIYGLGATFYTLLTGTTPADALYRMIRLGENEPDPLLPIDQLNSTVTKEKAEVISRAMSLSSTTRFPTVEQFWQALTVGTENELSHTLSTLSSSQARPLILTNDPVKSTVTISLPQEAQASHSRKIRTFLAILLALFIGLGIGTSTLLFVAGNRSSSAGIQARPLLHPATPLVSPSSSVATSTKTSVVYPPIAEQYNGTIVYLAENTKTTMTLSSISQNAGNITGYFSGLGLSGPFKGTVTTADHVQFQVTIYSGNELLSFEGTIQFGGNIAGTYQVFNANKQFTGETGLWSAAPVS